MTKEDDIMEYIVTIHSIKEISILKNADSFLIGNQKFAVRLNTSFNKMQPNFLRQVFTVSKTGYAKSFPARVS